MLYFDKCMPDPMNYRTSCVFTVVFTACSLCVHCVFIANEFWAPSSSSLCRGRRPSSSFVGRSVGRSVCRSSSSSVARRSSASLSSVGRPFGTFDLPLSESSDKGKFTLDIWCREPHELLTRVFSRLSSHRSPHRFLLRIATLHSKPAAQRAPADPRKSRLDFPI